MAQNLTSGAVQVLDNSVEAINAALAQMLEQLDHLRGLRGRTLMYDETGVASPTQASSAARLDNLQALLSDPADPVAAALRARPGPTATQGYYAEGVETMNLYAALQPLGMV